MRLLAAVLVALLAQQAAAPAAAESGGVSALPSALAQSTFDFDDDGWRVVGDPSDPSGLPSHITTGGNPGGHVTATDSQQGDVWYWEAPSKFLRGAAGARQLLFDLKQSQRSDQFEYDDVVLEGSGVRLVHRLPQSPAADWTSYSIVFNAGRGWVNTTTGFPASQDEIEAVLSSLAALRIRGEYRSGPDVGGLDNVMLVGLRPDQALADSEDGAPARIVAALEPISALVGENLNVLVFYQDDSGRPVVASRAEVITLDVSSGVLEQHQVTLRRSEMVARTRLRGTEPGSVLLQATGQSGSKSEPATADFCATGDVEGLGVRADRSQAPIGQPIEVTVRLVTGDGTIVSDGQAKSLDLGHRGVGRWLQRDSEVIPQGQCAARLVIASDVPGTADITVGLGSLDSVEQSFAFFVRFFHLALASLAAGATGALVRTIRSAVKSRTYTPVRWLVDLVVGALAGLLLFLVARIGLISVVEGVGFGWEVVLALGLIGGYLGHIAFNRIADRILPPARES